jgi:hypothetical protein
MQKRQGWYDALFLEAVRAYYGLTAAALESVHPIISVECSRLAIGMVLCSNIETKDGMLLLAAGNALSEMTLEKVRNFECISGIKEPIFVEAPVAKEGGP